MTDIRIGDRIFFTHRTNYAQGNKGQQASGLVLEIDEPKVGVGPANYCVDCDTPGVWFGTYNPKTNTRIVHVPEREVWRLT